MNKGVLSITTAFFLMLPLTMVAQATITEVPEPFKASDETSTHRIKFDEVSNMLRHSVVNTGQSSRKSAYSPRSITGTRMRQTVKQTTVNEGNRLYFELFEGSDDATNVLNNIKKGLEGIPSQVSLEVFPRNEQLAYWLNLYNVTLISEIAKIYPQHNLKKVLVGENSILDDKTMEVAGIPLSLNDIEFILWENYGGDPLIVYGLYQGIIGGPNIRRAAFTGKNVYRSLKKNAVEFINSNRGTSARSETTFRVSSFYERETPFFDSDETLKNHLMSYLESPESEKLRLADRIERNIDDWTITDLYGSHRNLGASFADSRAALMNMPGISPSHYMGVFYETPGNGRYSHELLLRLTEINERRLHTSEKNSTVTLEELGTVEEG